KRRLPQALRTGIELRPSAPRLPADGRTRGNAGDTSLRDHAARRQCSAHRFADLPLHIGSRPDRVRHRDRIACALALTMKRAPAWAPFWKISAGLAATR